MAAAAAGDDDGRNGEGGRCRCHELAVAMQQRSTSISSLLLFGSSSNFLFSMAVVETKNDRSFQNNFNTTNLNCLKVGKGRPILLL